MIDYKTFTINTNIILLFNNVFSKLFYTISFINYCNCYKLYTPCWPYQIFVHGALHGLMSEPATNNLTPEGMAPESLINLELAHKFDTVITESSRCRRTESMERPV